VRKAASAAFFYSFAFMKPSYLRYTYTSYFGGDFQLKRSKLGVKYRWSDYPIFQTMAKDKGWIEVEVNADQWKRFKTVILSLSQWELEYHEDVMDGQDWDVFIKYPERTIKSKGYFATPDDFERFEEGLIGLGVSSLNKSY
jgi:hypothetical protein